MRGDGMKKYVYKKDALPHVVLSEHAALTALFDYAFETAFRKVDYIEKAGWKPQLCHMAVGFLLHDPHHQLCQRDA